MTYFFSGVFVLGDEGTIARRISERFGGRVGAITKPVSSSVVAFAADYQWPEAPRVFDDALVRFSQESPQSVFVRLRTHCFGGSIDFEEGEVFQNGEVLGREESEEDSIIVPLFAYAGVSMQNGYLEPLTRDWFKGKGDVTEGLDRTYMRIALEVARAQVGKTSENPAVGCAVRTTDFPNPEAWCATADGGRPHAEELALAAAGEQARGATAYVTLEPCAKRSTGAMSCADRLIDAGVARVVIAARDPHPYAAGVGIERLRAAGVQVEIGLFEEEARAQNAGFFAKWERS